MRYKEVLEQKDEKIAKIKEEEMIKERERDPEEFKPSFKPDVSKS